MDGFLNPEQHVIAAAQHLVKALEASGDISNEMRQILVDLEVHLSTMAMRTEAQSESVREFETRLLSEQHNIMSLHSNHSNIWNSGPVVSEYLQSVGNVQDLIVDLESMQLKRGSRIKELFDQAQSILQMVMARLQKELVYILAQNKQCFEHEYVTLPVGEANPIYDESIVSNEDESVENFSQRESYSTENEEYVMDLIHPDVIPQIRSISDMMFDSGYGQEFCQAFTGFWRDTLAECLTTLDVENFSIEDVLQMEWKYLNSRIRKWRIAIKRIIGVYLISAKRLFDQILGDRGLKNSTCLMEASKASLLCLLNFGNAVSIGPHKPEWLFCLLNMYEALSTLVPEVDALFPEEIDSIVQVEFHELLTRLRDSVKAILNEFGNHIASCSSTNPYANGGIHPLTKYVMNYILCSAEYADTLNVFLQDPDMVNPEAEESAHDIGPDMSCTVGAHMRSLTHILEDNLYRRSNLYNGSPLKHIFLMNNIHYMVQKIRSNISPYFGDDWIRSHIVKYRKQAMEYTRVTWRPIVTLVCVEEKVGKTILKESCKAFATAFDDVYKSQTKWCVPDANLREELRISASNTVIPAYRNFVSAVTKSCCEKHIRYSEQELTTCIWDLFEGSSKALNFSWKR